MGGWRESWAERERERGEKTEKGRWRKEKKLHRPLSLSPFLSSAAAALLFVSLNPDLGNTSLSLSVSHRLNPQNLPQNCPASPLAKNTNENL